MRQATSGNTKSGLRVVTGIKAGSTPPAPADDASYQRKNGAVVHCD
jgi:hypothetical protein